MHIWSYMLIVKKLEKNSNSTTDDSLEDTLEFIQGNTIS